MLSFERILILVTIPLREEAGGVIILIKTPSTLILTFTSSLPGSICISDESSLIASVKIRLTNFTNGASLAETFSSTKSSSSPSSSLPGTTFILEIALSTSPDFFTLSYRVSISEVLIYGDLPTDEDSVNIEEITSNLSNIIAQSKVNIATLPDINEFEKHISLVKDAVTTAENLHGRYLGALRNNEYEVAQSISQGILLNNETESRAFENALMEFKEKSLLNYGTFKNLP